jgi:hypothetical protein
MMEETMRVLTINELWRLTRTELSRLAQRIATKLATYPEGSPARTAALVSLRNIRYVLSRRDPAP